MTASEQGGGMIDLEPFVVGTSVHTPEGGGTVVRVDDYCSHFVLVRVAGNFHPYKPQELRIYPQDVRAGDRLIPDPHWNRSTGDRRRHLPAAVEVDDVQKANCQTGVLVGVRSVSGLRLELSAGWFTGFAQ